MYYMDKLCKTTVVVLISVVLAASSAAFSFNQEAIDNFDDFNKTSESELNMSEKIEEKAERKVDTENRSAEIEKKIKEKIEEKVKQKEEEIKQKNRVSAAVNPRKSSNGFLSKIFDVFRR